MAVRKKLLTKTIMFFSTAELRFYPHAQWRFTDGMKEVFRRSSSERPSEQDKSCVLLPVVVMHRPGERSVSVVGGVVEGKHPLRRGAGGEHRVK